jgi:RNA polymerase sigma-70 factor (ECF subfamily)
MDPPAAASPAEAIDLSFESLARVALRTLRRLGVDDEAISDAAQDALLVVHRRRDEFRGESALQTWFYGILLRVASEHRRKIRQRRSLFLLSDAPVGEHTASDEPSPFDNLERAAAARLLHELLDQLPELLRAVFVLVELEELSIPDAAQALDVSLTTCKSRLRTARRAFDAAATRERSRLGGKGAAP